LLLITPRLDFRSSGLLLSADVSGQPICDGIKVPTPLKMEPRGCP